jgi:MFS family permease
MSPFPFTACGALIASKMAIDTWRWVYYLNIILSGLALIAVVLFYYPVSLLNAILDTLKSETNYLMLQPVPYAEVSRWKLIKSHDWFGAGLLVVWIFWPSFSVLD